VHGFSAEEEACGGRATIQPGAQVLDKGRVLQTWRWPRYRRVFGPVAIARIELCYCLDESALSTAIFAHQEGYSTRNGKASFPNQLRYGRDREGPSGKVRRPPRIRTPVNAFNVSGKHQDSFQVSACASFHVHATRTRLRKGRKRSGLCRADGGHHRAALVAICQAHNGVAPLCFGGQLLMRIPPSSGQPPKRRSNALGVVHGPKEAQEIQS
jgi:hypothetical protein